jgi:hypothetical protein
VNGEALEAVVRTWRDTAEENHARAEAAERKLARVREYVENDTEFMSLADADAILRLLNEDE